MSLADQPPVALEWAANIFELLLLGFGVVLLVKQILRERSRPPEHLEPWRANWQDFALWCCVIAFVLSVGAMLFVKIYPVAPNAKLTPTDELILGCVQHTLILLAQVGILLSLSSLSPAPLNQKKLPVSHVFAKGVLAFVTAYPVIVIANLSWQVVLDWIQHLFPHWQTPPQSVVQLISNKPDYGVVALTILFAVVLAPINEELLFRGSLYRFLKGKFSRRVALGLASFLFALIHFNILSFATLFVIGWLLARTYERSGHIGVCMVFHALFNLYSIAMSLVF